MQARADTLDSEAQRVPCPALRLMQQIPEARPQKKRETAQHGRQKDIFPHAARGAEPQRKAILATERMQRHPRGVEHVQHDVTQRAKAHTQHDRAPVRRQRLP